MLVLKKIKYIIIRKRLDSPLFISHENMNMCFVCVFTFCSFILISFFSTYHLVALFIVINERECVRERMFNNRNSSIERDEWVEERKSSKEWIYYELWHMTWARAKEARDMREFRVLRMDFSFVIRVYMLSADGNKCIAHICDCVRLEHFTIFHQSFIYIIICLYMKIFCIHFPIVLLLLTNLILFYSSTSRPKVFPSSWLLIAPREFCSFLSTFAMLSLFLFLSMPIVIISRIKTHVGQSISSISL